MRQSRLNDVRRFYSLLEELERKLGGRRVIGQAHGRQLWPTRGVYFVFEPGEERTTSGSGPRVVRVGTHALKSRSRTTLWGRLRSHRGALSGRAPGGGNHRGSVFRLHVGTALLNEGEWGADVGRSWGDGASSIRAVRIAEAPLEHAVSEHIARMSLLWVRLDDPPGPDTKRGYIERNAVSLLSNYRAREQKSMHSGEQPIVDPPSSKWLGNRAKSERVQLSGLWNSDFVDGTYDPDSLTILEGIIRDM